jgi:hypothetical protein
VTKSLPPSERFLYKLRGSRAISPAIKDTQENTVKYLRAVCSETRTPAVDGEFTGEYQKSSDGLNARLIFDHIDI